jgi:phosphomannomutase
MSIYKDCDIRGIYPREFDERSAYTIGRALATLHPGARLAVGGDVRTSTPSLKSALIQGLTDSGAEICRALVPYDDRSRDGDAGAGGRIPLQNGVLRRGNRRGALLVSLRAA